MNVKYHSKKTFGQAFASNTNVMIAFYTLHSRTCIRHRSSSWCINKAFTGLSWAGTNFVDNALKWLVLSAKRNHYWLQSEHKVDCWNEYDCSKTSNVIRAKGKNFFLPNSWCVCPRTAQHCFRHQWTRDDSTSCAKVFTKMFEWDAVLEKNFWQALLGLCAFQTFLRQIYLVLSQYFDEMNMFFQKKYLGYASRHRKLASQLNPFYVRALLSYVTKVSGANMKPSTIESSRAGTGCFATRFLAKGEIIAFHCYTSSHKTMLAAFNSQKVCKKGMMANNHEWIYASTILLTYHAPCSNEKCNSAWLVASKFAFFSFWTTLVDIKMI